jgi:hypothetical protein
MASPTAHTLKRLRRCGYVADVVERFVPYPSPGHHKDFIGCVDILAFRVGEAGVLAVQATSADNISARVKKSVTLPALKTWLAAGNRFEVWGWAQRGNKGKWVVKIVSVQAGDMRPVVIEKLRRRRPDRHQQGNLFEDPCP